MRTLFIFLVLANLIFLAWVEGYFGVADEGREPQRLARQLAPEKLKIVGAALPGGKQQLEVCRLIDGLAGEDAQRLAREAQEKLPGARLAAERAEDPTAFWVLIPPLADRAAADRKLAELKRLGVSGYHLVEEEGAFKLAILLGAFASQQAGNEFLQSLGKRGVRSARLQTREKTLLKVQAQGGSDILETRLRELLQPFPSASLIPCTEKP